MSKNKVTTTITTQEYDVPDEQHDEPDEQILSTPKNIVRLLRNASPPPNRGDLERWRILNSEIIIDY